ncbi:MAG: 30S ribosome-binding factor RbfA [Neomegalonema sp.]|nr:30S ribosome-binding factor RbfA [Neomegalonema sp.]
MSRREPNLSGPSQRQLKVGENVRRALSDVLMRGDIHDAALGRMSITVSEVRMSPDLRHATAFVLPLGGRDAELALEALNQNAGELRHLVTRAVTLKFSPQLHFVLDESFDRMDTTRRLLDDERVRRDIDARHDDDADTTESDDA